MSVSDYPMDNAEETECPECGRSAAKVTVDRSRSTMTYIKRFRCGHESEEEEAYEQGGWDDDDEDYGED